ncbi:interleukin-17 receptor D [Lampris incognitus]|uniref:interleukin-17 receptor D n=1 Tax=Lampris incognitus TaxID=2546036 RepID=UPI0024B6069D|nr:interleukin-17 receptor D [Lampris incognitus]
MQKAAVFFFQLLILRRLLRAQEDPVGAGVNSPQDCSLECIRGGEAGCEYCRISRADVERARGFHSIEAFGTSNNGKFGKLCSTFNSFTNPTLIPLDFAPYFEEEVGAIRGCIPLPCFALLGAENPEICQHYVRAPRDVTVEFVNDTNPKYDTIVVSWRPSNFGIAFLRGFQVSLQALGGSPVSCQLFLFHSNLSLPASRAQTVYRSDPFSSLPLGVQYKATVMALPVPEKWDGFSNSQMFSTRSCAEKNGFELCKNDWYPRHIEVQQKGTEIIVTFNLAPPNLGIRGYFSLCYGEGTKKYTDIRPNSTKNKTHYSYNLNGLQQGTNYTCEIAADEVDAVRKIFIVQVMQNQQAKPFNSSSPLALILPLGLVLVAIFVVLLILLTRQRPKLWMKKVDITAVYLDVIEECQDESPQEEVVALPISGLIPPRLLICYSRRDGPAHVKAIMQLGAFMRKHMGTQVYLDLWDSLSIAEEGAMTWYCRQIQESDFVLVVCSRGLSCRPELMQPHLEEDGEEEEEELGCDSNTLCSVAAVALICEQVGRAKARGEDLSKYMAAIFEYSEETDIPAELDLVSHYSITRDFPLLFSHLHGLALHRPGGYLKIEHLSEESFTKLPAGAALQVAICEAGRLLREKEQQSAAGGQLKHFKTAIHSNPV